MSDESKQPQVGRVEFSDPLARPLVKRLVAPSRACSGTMFAQHAPITYGHELDACPFCAALAGEKELDEALRACGAVTCHSANPEYTVRVWCSTLGAAQRLHSLLSRRRREAGRT